MCTTAGEKRLDALKIRFPLGTAGLEQVPAPHAKAVHAGQRR